MTIQLRPLFSTCLLVFSLFLGTSTAQAQEDENLTNAVPSPTVTGNKYPESVIKDYLLNCAQIAAEQGLVGEEAQSICQCTIGKFQSTHTLEQFQQLTKASANNNKNAEATLTEVGYTCFEEMYF